ncbi:uncharacterized protein LOC109726126 [Ananas comosus]|uniref:Uncharacterized protein LOC109726126 n=1 Tax=Ananas comosus TaxID=4615 RepID=A0A6P5GZS7_ANACO|nr:uncharacterized protein LOC109726126 [Ananas comosus]
MGFDAMANDASAHASNPKDAAKKKRGNRSAKLKQCKLDARREQWLSQVKSNKDGKITSTCAVSPSVASPHSHPPLSQTGKDGAETRRRREEDERDDSSLHEMSDLDSPTHSPTSNASANPSRNAQSIINILSSSGSSIGSSSRSVSDEEEEEAGKRDQGEDGGVLDDWEAVADALTAGNDPGGQESGPQMAQADPVASPGSADVGPCRRASTHPEPVCRAPRAWRPDDAFRPQSLPSISKQRSFTMGMERHWGGPSQKGILSLPSSCPICCEDLDSTDSSFLPCSCGFRLCLFCHKRILEADGRCPGCRKQYDTAPGGIDGNGGAVPLLPLRLYRSCSMSSRY